MNVEHVFADRLLNMMYDDGNLALYWVFQLDAGLSTRQDRATLAGCHGVAWRGVAWRGGAWRCGADQLQCGNKGLPLGCQRTSPFPHISKSF